MQSRKSLTWMVSLVALIASCVTISSCNKKFDEPPTFIEPNLTVNKTIADLKAIHVNGQVESITDDLIIAGIVNADDKSGNYYKQISIQDSTGGITIRLDGNSLYADYPVGRKIYVKLKGLFMGDYNGLIQLGGSIDNSGSFLNVSGIASNLFDTYIVKSSIGNVITPKVVTVAGLNNSYQSMLIQIDNSEFAVADTNKTFADAAGSLSVNLNAKSCTGSAIIIRTSGYANFAGINVPNGNGPLRAIYTTFGSTKQLIVRDTSDVAFYGPRCSAGGGGGGGNGARVSIAALRAMYTGSDIMIGSYKIGGVVISDAANKNVSNGLVVLQDGNAGISVYFGGTLSYNIGDSVVVDVTGDSLINYRGSLEVKTPFGATAPAANATGQVITPQTKTAAELTAALATPLGSATNIEFTLVKIVGATASPAGTYAGNKTLTDASGTIAMFTTSAATFAASTLPTASTDWTGYASSFNTTRQFQVRNLSDVVGGGTTPPPTGAFATYDFAGVTTTSGMTDPTPVPTVTGVTFGSFTAVGVGGTNSSGAGRFSFNDWPLVQTIDAGKYYQVTITPNAGVQLDLTSLTFRFQRSGTGARQAVVRGSIDSYGANLPASISPADPALSIVGTNVIEITDISTGVNGSTITLPATYLNLTSAVTFRFYGMFAEAAGGTFSIDDVKFNGSTH